MLRNNFYQHLEGVSNIITEKNKTLRLEAKTKRQEQPLASMEVTWIQVDLRLKAPLTPEALP